MRRTVAAITIWGALVLGALTVAGAAEAQTWRTMTSARQAWDREPVDVQVQYGAGTLNVGPADRQMLYTMEIRYDEEVFSPVAEYDAERRRLRLGVRGGEGRRRMNVRDGATATIGLGRDVPLDLNLEFGAGRADIQLGGVAIRRLSLSTGASETTVGFGEPNPQSAERLQIEAGAADLRVTGLGNARAERIEFKGGVGATLLDFGGSWDRSTSASVQMGVGSVTLRLPRSVGVRVDRNSFLTSFSAPGLERQGNSYVSANWDSAAHQLTIHISAALGSIDIQWID